MDSREPQPPPPAPPSQQQQHHQHQQQQHSMMLGPASSNSYLQNPPPSMITPGGIHPAAGGFPFNSAKPTTMDGVSFDGSSPPSSAGMRFGGGGGGGGGGGLSVDQGKKKRGRPRKYTPDGNIALGLSPTPISSSGNSIGLGDPSSAAAAAAAGSATPGVASEPAPKKNRGRPPGSGKKQLDALGGVGGIGFTPHVITVKAGEDIASKIMAFSQQGPRTVCILSANGAICNVTLRQPATSGGTVTYEGRYEIISLSGSFLLSENNGSRSRTGGLSVSLAGSDGRVLGGGVAGMLMAASPVQVIVGSFIADGKRSHSNLSKSGPSSAPPTQMLNFGAATTASPPSHGGSTESSDENGSSPLNRGPGIYGNSGQHMHNMQMYQLWAGQNPH